MIYVAKKDVKEIEFLNLLESSRKLLIIEITKKKISPIGFEELVYKKMCESAIGTIYEGKIVQTGVHAFPDIVANGYFGIEVKMTLSDHWTSTGNSVLESSRVEDVEKIYILFGKFGGKADIKYRLYQECLPAISVTHSPRYKINMNLEKGESIFDKIGIDYDKLRKNQNVIKTIKDYYRSQLKAGEELWWIDPDQEITNDSPIIKPFRNLSPKEKENFIVEAMILFPEMFGNNNTKFERAAAYLITQYNSVSANLRDSFTAGGQKTIKLKKRNVTIPKILFNMRTKAKLIKEKINTLDEQTLENYWRVKIKKNRLKQWIDLVNQNTLQKAPISDVFKSGL